MRGSRVADDAAGTDAGWPRLEEDLREPVKRYLRAKGYLVRDEVWINGRIADLYAFDDEESLAVELKLADWREATVQAMAYQLAALYTYVALPLDRVHRVLRQRSLLARHGVGLLAVAPGTGPGFSRADASGAEPPPVSRASVREVLAARASDRYLPFLAEKVQRDAKRPKRTGMVLPREW